MASFDDWDVFNSSTFRTSIINVSPIVGTGSIACGQPPANVGGTLFSHFHPNNTFTQGLTKGRLRCITRFDWDVLPVSTFDNTGAFMFFMQEQEDPINVAGDFYAVGFVRRRNSAAITPLKFMVLKIINKAFTSMNYGSATTGDVIQVTEPDITYAQGDPIPMQVEWDYNPAVYTGVRITASHGPVGDTDFDNLDVKYDFIDYSSPITVANYEGFGFLYDDNTLWLPTEYQTFDNTDVISLA